VSARPARDSSGTPLVILNSLNQPSAPGWRTTLLYSTARADSLPLGFYVDARFQRDSSLVVTHNGELLVFTPAGELARTIGREGDGPGEFRVINRLAIAEDGTLLVGDMGSGRVTLLESSGAVRRIVPRLGSATPSYEVDPLTLLPDGRIVAAYWQARPNRDAVGIAREGFERDSAPLLLFDSSGSGVVARLGSWEGLERATVSLQGGRARLPPPFARTALFHARGSWIAAGSTDSLDLLLYHDTVATLRLVAPWRRHLPGAGAAGRWEAAIRREYPDVASMYLEAVAAARRVSALPALGAVRVDDGGNLWVGAHIVPGEGERQWWIFSRVGSPMGTLKLPAWDEPMMSAACELLDVFGDRIALLRADSSGAPYVEVHRLIR
jgi:hypothetical protein